MSAFRERTESAALAAAALWLFLSGSAILRADCTPRAVAIGISVYKDPSFDPNPVLHGRQDAEAFADWFRHHAVCSSGAKPGVEPVVETLTDESATGPAIRYKLQDVFLRASSDDEIFIFISARGIRAPGYGDEGYLIGSDGLKGRLYSSGVSVGNLSGIIPRRGVGRVFLFADISRDLPNLNEIVADLKGRLAANPKLSAVLSAQPKRVSTDTGVYPQGLFTHFLMEELDGSPNGKITLPVLYQHLRRNILQATQSKQDPTAFGQDTVVVDSILPEQPAFRRERVLVASLEAPPAGAFEEQTTVPDALLNDLSDAAVLESKAQDILLRYGEGNQFPDDPLRPGPVDFATAADAYERALAARAALPVDEQETSLRNSLRARMLFCRGRALIFDRRYDEARTLLEQAQNADPLLPEPANALGIVYLEQSQYDRAIPAFRRSIQLANKWGYPRLNLALTLAEAGNYAAAEGVYREAIAAAPSQPYLFFNYGILLARLNRRHEAEQEFRAALRAFDAQASVYRRLAGVLTGAAATATLQEAETVTRNEAEAYNALASVQHGSTARGNYLEALKHNDRLTAAQYNLGILALRSRDYGAAIDRFSAVLKDSPDFADATHRLDCARKGQQYAATQDRTARAKLRLELNGCQSQP